MEHGQRDGALGRILNDRYVVERELGRGGMATVYLARDLQRDGAPVAVKLLLPDLGAALGPERFRREIEIEQQLDHPNILGILDWGEQDARLFYVMPYVAGESLRARMEHERQLPVDEAVRIATAVAHGLAHAHQRGIVHRDVKPENILLDGGRVLVADFGIARALSADQEQKLTQTGVTLGTPLYMSPEQAMGERDLDGRSDQYALGCVLYEMLAGEPPFTGPNAQAITARHLVGEVPPLTIVRPAVSDELEDITVRALAKPPADRWPTLEAFAGALEHCLSTGHTTERRTVATPRPTRAAVAARRAQRRSWIVAGAGLLALALGGLGAWQAVNGDQRIAGAADLATKRVAVLYLQDATGGRLAYLADGITDLLIDELTQAGLNVVSRNGVLPWRGVPGARDSAAVAMGGAEGDLGLIVDGLVEEQEGRANVTLHLVSGAGGDPLAAESFSFPLDSAVARGDSLTPYVEEMERFLRRRIGTTVELSDRRAAAGSDAAWTLVQRAELARKQADAAWAKGDTAAAARQLDAADSLAREAARLSPRWVEPLVFRGQVARLRADRGAPVRARPWLDSAAALAAAALARDPRSPAALELRGLVTHDVVLQGLAADDADVHRRVEEAAADLNAAVQRDGRRAAALVRLSALAYQQHDVSAAADYARRAYEADAYLAQAPNILWRLFATQYDLNVPKAAERWCTTGHERFPELYEFTHCRILLMTMSGVEPDVALGWRLLEELESRLPPPERPFEMRLNRALFAAAIARAGLPDSARAVLAAARATDAIDPRGELLGYQAFAYGVLGDNEEALRLLRTYLERNPEHREGFTRINAWWWNSLKQDPRFTRLVGDG